MQAIVAESPVRSSELLSSGYINDPITADFKKWGFRAVAYKPYTIDELKKGLHDPFIP